MKKKAVCVRCGTFKKAALDRCKSCGFVPQNDYEAARSLILSETHVLNSIEIGRSAEQLQEIARSIRSGRPYPIDGEEQKQVVREYYQFMKTHPPSRWPWSRKLKWAALTSTILIIVVAIAYTLLRK